MKKSKIKPISEKKQALDKKYRELIDGLVRERAKGRCEVCGGDSGLGGHHIQKRSKGRLDTEENILIVCCLCHRHDVSTTGIITRDGKPMPVEEQFEIVKRQNAKMGNSLKSYWG